MIQIYTLPTCEHCHEAVRLMKEKEIPFQQIDTGSSEGLKRFREFYSVYREQIARDDSGCAVLPIVYNDGNSNLHQGTDGLAKFLGI